MGMSFLSAAPMEFSGSLSVLCQAGKANLGMQMSTQWRKAGDSGVGGGGVTKAPSKIHLVAPEFRTLGRALQLPSTWALLQTCGPSQGRPGHGVGRRGEVHGGTT